MSKKVCSRRDNSFSLGPIIGLIVLSLTVLCSCIPITKRSVAPMELPAHFSMPGEVPLQTRWWLDLEDKSLTLLVNQAIADNFSLRIAKERIIEAEAVARQVGASLVPALDGQGTYSSTRDYQTDKSRKNYFLGLEASYEIDLWGRLRAQTDAAVLEAMATEADYHTAVISIAAEVATTWFQLVETDLQIELVTKQQETNAKVLELISAQFRSGQVGIADVLQQRQLVESNGATLAELRGDAQILEHQLAILVGAPPGTADLPQPVQLPTLPPLPETGIPLDLLTNRPDIESSFQRLQAADNRVAAAVADQLPRLSISADFSTSGIYSGDLFNNWFSTLGANLLGPLFDGGRRKEEVVKNESLATQQFFNHGQIILEAIGEVENSLVREKQQQAILGSQETQLQYATETIEHVGNRYRQGVEGYLRVLQALVSQQGLQRNILTSRRQLINSRIALYRALSVRIPLEETAPNDQNKQEPPAPINTLARGSN
jgi:NodT family efflux transporter outer membrane factor (OMF) lipoprotein